MPRDRDEAIGRLEGMLSLLRGLPEGAGDEAPAAAMVDAPAEVTQQAAQDVLGTSMIALTTTLLTGGASLSSADALSHADPRTRHVFGALSSALVGALDLVREGAGGAAAGAAAAVGLAPAAAAPQAPHMVALKLYDPDTGSVVSFKYKHIYKYYEEGVFLSQADYHRSVRTPPLSTRYELGSRVEWNRAVNDTWAAKFAALHWRMALMIEEEMRSKGVGKAAAVEAVTKAGGLFEVKYGGCKNTAYSQVAKERKALQLQPIGRALKAAGGLASRAADEEEEE